MSILYNLVLIVYFSLFRLAAIFYPKAASWWNLRLNWSRSLDVLSSEKRSVWIHVASAGEFEQAIPLINRIRESRPDLQVVVSAFSNSGHEACLRSGLADSCFPFPPEFNHNVKLIINKINPLIAVFIRNEIWLNTLKQLKDQLSPAILINAEQERRRGIYGFYLEKAYTLFSRVCYTRETGSTKIERVLQVAGEPFSDPVLEDFSLGSTVLILGSCYDPEVKQLARDYPALRDRYPGLKLVLCPHQWDDQTQDRYQDLFGEPVARYTDGPASVRILFIDRMGILKYVYRYADAAYVGGGFGRGIHNVSEATVYGIPVLTGPAWHRFPEVKTGINTEQVKVLNDLHEMGPALLSMLGNKPTPDQLASWRSAFDAEREASREIWKIMETYINR